MPRPNTVAIGFILALLAGFSAITHAADKPRKIVLIAGPITGHPKEAHEYEKNVILLKHLLDTSPNLQGKVRVETHFKGWPSDPATLDDADTIFLTSDGCDRRETDHPFYVGDRLQILERQMRRGCGLVMFHWSTFNPVRAHQQITEWAGGYFDYETGPEPRKWYSAIQTWQAASVLGTPDHPISRGVKPFTTREEYYYRMRFRENDPRLKPIVLTRPPNETNDFAVGWAVERADGGRGFGFTGGHFYQNWWNPDFRKLILNAVAWSARLDVPAGGVESEPFARFKALVITGHNHPAHDWRAVTAALIPATEQDPRAIVHVTENIEDLAQSRPRKAAENSAAPARALGAGGYNIFDYDLLVMNYNNWDKPGLSDASKGNLIRYLSEGGGLAIVHFANGAFNLTLPNKESDWPEYRTNIARRVWMAGEGRSGHDNYGPFRVEITDVKHPIIAGRDAELEPPHGIARESVSTKLSSFDTVDELYFRQEGGRPIEALATARSKVTGNDEPMAWAYAYGKGRVFQTVLGHSEESVRKAAALIRRGSAWAAGQKQISFDPPAELTEGVLFRDGSPWTPEQSRKRADASGQGVLNSGSGLALPEPHTSPPGFGLRQSSGAFETAGRPKSGRGLPHSKTLTRTTTVHGLSTQQNDAETPRAVTAAILTASNKAAPPKVLPANAGLDQGGKFGHWGNEGEEDWVDDRWNRMEPDAIFCSSLQTLAGLALKSIAIRVGANREGGVCFDAGQLNLKAGWTGGFIRKSPKRFGIIEMPRLEGTVAFASVEGPAWGKAPTRYRGLHLHDQRVVLSYDVSHASVLDSPWLETSDGLNIFTRSMEIGPTSEALRLTLLNTGRSEVGIATNSMEGGPLAVLHKGGGITAVRVTGAKVDLALGVGDRLVVNFPANKEVQHVKIFIWKGDRARLADFHRFVGRARKPEDLAAMTKPGPQRWPQTLTTRGSLGSGPGPFAIDTLTLPYENPFKALWFVSGHDFFSNGDAALSTLHGDVWRVTGIDDRLERLTWKRMASGLFQPLGLKIVNDQVHVIGRDQITRLHDANGDGEADFYESFHNGIETSAGGHDFVTCLESDADGNLLYLDPQGLHRVAADGSRQETLATGWRNPNGLSVSPTGVMTASPQEGEWTPTSQVTEVKDGGYYGYGGPKTTPDRPLGYDPPLCWIPRYLDNSSGGEVWVPRNAWGPLAGQLLHLSFGRCQMMLVLRDKVDGQPQGAIVPISGRFLSGVMRGRFHPSDGHLYVSGMKGWVTSALRDGCFQRVRRTGTKLSLPIGLRVHSNGVQITFSEPLNRKLAADPESFAVEQWNYRYAADYGSKEYSPSQVGVEGHDPVEVRRVSLLEDERTVFLETPDLKPVMQLQVQYNLEDKDGAMIRNKLVATVNHPAPAFEQERKFEARSGTFVAQVSQPARRADDRRASSEFGPNGTAVEAQADASSHMDSPQTQPPSRPNQPVKLNRPGLKNLFQFAPGFYRCAQPTAQGMRELEALGVKTIINLRPFHSDRDEVKGTGLRRERISFKTWNAEDADVIRFLKIATDTNRAPFAVHCLHGSDRTGMMVAVHRIVIQGWSKDAAIAEMTGPEFGFHTTWQNLVCYVRALDVEKIKRKAGIAGTAALQPPNAGRLGCRLSERLG